MWRGHVYKLLGCILLQDKMQKLCLVNLYLVRGPWSMTPLQVLIRGESSKDISTSTYCLSTCPAATLNSIPTPLQLLMPTVQFVVSVTPAAAPANKMHNISLPDKIAVCYTDALTAFCLLCCLSSSLLHCAFNRSLSPLINSKRFLTFVLASKGSCLIRTGPISL